VRDRVLRLKHCGQSIAIKPNAADRVLRMRDFAGGRLASLAQLLLRCYNSGAAVRLFAHSRRVAR
jgi:hypothetical protein